MASIVGYMITTAIGGLPALAKRMCGDESRWAEVYESNPDFVRIVYGKKQYRQMRVSDTIVLPEGWKYPTRFS